MNTRNGRRLGLALAIALAITSQSASGQQNDDDLLLTNPIVGDEMVPLSRVPNYRNQMRDIIQELSDYARKRDPSFAIVARPGFELLRWDQREFILAEAKRPRNMMIPDDAIVPLGLPMRRFIQAIDGIALSNQFCGEGIPLPRLQRFQAMGVAMMSIEHCGTDAAAFGAVEQARESLMISHADADRTDVFDRIPIRRPIDENAENIETLDDARNMLVATQSRPKVDPTARVGIGSCQLPAQIMMLSSSMHFTMETNPSRKMTFIV